MEYRLDVSVLSDCWRNPNTISKPISRRLGRELKVALTPRPRSVSRSNLSRCRKEKEIASSVSRLSKLPLLQRNFIFNENLATGARRVLSRQTPLPNVQSENSVSRTGTKHAILSETVCCRENCFKRNKLFMYLMEVITLRIHCFTSMKYI